MKSLLAASALLLCFACAREELGTDDRIVGGHDKASEMIFSAVSPSTKTMMGESVEGKRPVYWSEGDKICVNGVVSDPLEGVSENATAAVFRVGSGLDAPFKGLYPASFYTDASTITLPSVQTWESGSFANGSFPMASYTQDQREEMAFRFLCSMLKLSIKQDSSQAAEADEIASVVFRGNDGEQVSGAFTIDYQNATLSATSSSDNDKIVGMIVNQALSVDNALDIYLVVPANVYASGFTLSITDAQGRVMKKSSNKSQTLKAGIIAKLPEFVFVPNAEGGDDPIPEDLIPQEGDVTEDGEPVVMYFGARIDNGEGDDEGTKTHLGDLTEGEKEGKTYYYYPNLWTVGDKVAINGVASASLPEANISNEGKRARFPMAQVVDKCAGYYYVGYPYTDGSTSGFTGFSNGTGTVIIPSEQTYTAGTYDPRAFVLIGKSTTQVMTFTPKMALLRVTPTNSDTPYAYKISKVRLESIGGEAMSGTFTTNFEDSFEAISGVSYIEISAPTDDGLDFGNPFFFMIPAQTYAKGLRFIVYTKDGKSMTFSNGSSYTASYGSSRSISSPKYTPSVSGSVSCDFLTSSSAGFSWSGGNASNNVKKPWRLAIYNDEECTSLKVAYNIPADPDATGVWKDQGGTPHFIVGGLTPGTTYYCQVTDVNNNIAMEPISFTTDSFFPVAAASPVGNVLLAENFGEFGHGSASLGGYEGSRFGGWSPQSNNPEDNSIDCAAPTGEVTTGAYMKYDTQLRIADGFDFNTAPRFKAAGWGFTADGLDEDEVAPSVYSQPGAMRFGTKNYHRVFLVLPTLAGITSGKFATVDVTIKASHVVMSDVSRNDLAVFLEDNLTITNATRHIYSTPSLTRPYPFDVEEYGASSGEYTVRIDGVQNTDHLIIGAYANVNERNRFQIYSVIVTNVSESDVETFDITDDVSLRTFYARVDDAGNGEKSLNAKVLADVTASSVTTSGWTPLDGYTGTLDGQDHSGANHTITGLTTPFFNELKGTVQNLTLDSDVAEDSDPNVGIFARTLAASSAASGLYNCTAKSGSSVTGTYTAAFSANACIGGLVGRVSQGGTLSGCVNNATVSVTNTTATSAYDIYVGGVAGYTEAGWSSGTLSAAATLTDCVNNGAVTNGASTTTTAVRMCVGGAFGLTVASNLTRCANTAEVRNDGASGKTTSLGGLCGSTLRSNSTPCVLSACFNTGAVKNYGVATDSNNLTLRLGGLVGWVDQPNNLSGTSFTNCNYNNGPVTDYSGSSRPAIGGICGYVNNASTTLDYCENRSSGVITTSWASKTIGYEVYVGGIVGYCNVGISLSHVSNAANINMTTSTTVNSTVLVGGVVGYLNSGSASADNISNSGSITISNLTAGGNFYVGGLMAYQKGTLTGACTNGSTGTLSISVTVTSNNNIYAGGLCGKSDGTLTGTSGQRLVNDGAVTIQSGSSASKCLVAGITSRQSGAISYCTNNATISNAATTTNISYISGVSALSTETIGYCCNTGDVTNSGSVTGSYDLDIGGLAGNINANVSNSYNTGDVTNTGNPGADLCLGGLVGNSSNNMTFTACYNTGDVSNSGSGNILAIGGLTGWSNTTTYTSSCYNSGTVSNTGSGSSTQKIACLRMGGLVGCARNANTLTGTSSVYNENRGAVLEKSSSTYVAVGGVVGFNDNASTDVAYARNTSDADITVEGNTRYRVAVGGVVGYSQTVLGMDYAQNAGDIEFKSLTLDVNDTYAEGVYKDGHVFGGGILGAYHCDDTYDTETEEYIDGANQVAASTVTGCVNSGKIICKDKDSKGGNMFPASASVTLFSYFGGITGMGDIRNKSFLNCRSTGDITIYNHVKSYVGGVIAYSNICPVGSSCAADITYYKYNKKDGIQLDGAGSIGGVVGFLIATTIQNLTYEGALATRGSSTAPFTGGIVGQIGGWEDGGIHTVFDGCNLSGSVKGAGTGYDTNGPGLFGARPKRSPWTFNFTNCKVKTGTQRKADVTVTITADNIGDWIIGRYKPTSTPASLPSIVDSF